MWPRPRDWDGCRYTHLRATPHNTRSRLSPRLHRGEHRKLGTARVAVALALSAHDLCNSPIKPHHGVAYTIQKGGCIGENISVISERSRAPKGPIFETVVSFASQTSIVNKKEVRLQPPSPRNAPAEELADERAGGLPVDASRVGAAPQLAQLAPVVSVEDTDDGALLRSSGQPGAVHSEGHAPQRALVRCAPPTPQPTRTRRVRWARRRCCRAIRRCSHGHTAERPVRTSTPRDGGHDKTPERSIQRTRDPESLCTNANNPHISCDSKTEFPLHTCSRAQTRSFKWRSCMHLG